jgi:hypothetical protein
MATAPKFGYGKSYSLGDADVSLKVGGREIPLVRDDVQTVMFPKGSFHTTEKINPGEKMEVHVSAQGFKAVSATTVKPSEVKPFRSEAMKITRNISAAFKVFGDVIDGSPQEMKLYNYTIFEWLDDKYGKQWIQDVRKEVVGYGTWVLYQDAVPYLLCQTKPIFNGRSSTSTGRSDIDFSFWVIQHMEVEEPYRISGHVTVRVLLSEEGEILDIDDIGRIPYTYLSAAFIRAMRTAPKWTPGYHNGKPCKVLMTIPVHIDFR